MVGPAGEHGGDPGRTQASGLPAGLVRGGRLEDVA